MKVRELIEALQKFDPEMEVVKQKDDEGNGYSLVYAVDDEGWAMNDRRSNPDYSEMYHPDDKDEYEKEGTTFTQCVVIV